ncbi:MAG: hypothetical protein KAH01_08300 [Caldisericia bacterium]|nr:hypothetical protein [Caldisericia bacterium]
MKNNNQLLDIGPVTLGQWLTTYLLLSIPIIGIIMLFVWSFSKRVNPSKKTWAQCVLIVMFIVSAVSTVLWLVTGWSFFSIL